MPCSLALFAGLLLKWHSQGVRPEEDGEVIVRSNKSLGILGPAHSQWDNCPAECAECCYACGSNSFACMTSSHTYFSCILKDPSLMPPGRECESTNKLQDGRSKVNCKYLHAEIKDKAWKQVEKDGKCNDVTKCCCKTSPKFEDKELVECGSKEILCRTEEEALEEFVWEGDRLYQKIAKESQDGLTKDNVESTCVGTGRHDLTYVDFCARSQCIIDHPTSSGIDCPPEKFLKNDGCCIRGGNGEASESLLESMPPGFTAGSLGKFKRKKTSGSKKKSYSSSSYSPEKPYWRQWECEEWEQIPACSSGQVPYKRVPPEDSGVCLGNRRGKPAIDPEDRVPCTNVGMSDRGCACAPGQPVCGDFGIRL